MGNACCATQYEIEPDQPEHPRQMEVEKSAQFEEFEMNR